MTTAWWSSRSSSAVATTVIAEHLAPFGEAAVGGEDHGALLVSGIDELEEQIAAAGRDRQVSDLVDDQQRGSGQEADAFPELAFALGLGQRGDDVGERGEVDAAAGLDGLDGEGRGQDGSCRCRAAPADAPLRRGR